MPATDLHVMPAENGAPIRYRIAFNITGPGFDVDIAVDGLPGIGPSLQAAVLAVVDQVTLAATGGDR